MSYPSIFLLFVCSQVGTAIVLWAEGGLAIDSGIRVYVVSSNGLTGLVAVACSLGEMREGELDWVVVVERVVDIVVVLELAFDALGASADLDVV
jgi:hypothetical protein